MEQAVREGDEEQIQRIHNDYRFKRVFLEDLLLWNWGIPLKAWTMCMNIPAETKEPLPLLNHTIRKYHFSDQKAAFPEFPSLLPGIVSRNSSIRNMPYWKNTAKGGKIRHSRIFLAKKCCMEGTIVYQRFFAPLHFLLCEVVDPILHLIVSFGAVIVRLLLLAGFRFPLLSWYYIVPRLGLFGKEVLRDGENGYTKIFRRGEHINIDDLESELMTRNLDGGSSPSLQRTNIIAVSYKHYANKGKVLGDDGRICRTDLQALAMFIKAAAPCNVQFWIDSKLQPTNDNSFERWINRGVRPYGRYITFLCPSAIENAESSFWLANELQFALAGKGVMYLEGDQIYYAHMSSLNNVSWHRRLLHIVIGAEDRPTQVRDEDKDKVINWALCCLRGSDRTIAEGFSPFIDNLEMVGKVPHELLLLNNIRDVIRAYGPQELPVIPGRCWNKQNPCMLGDASHQEFDLSNWIGFSRDGSPTRVYFVHQRTGFDVGYPTIMVLEVTLDKPHFNPGKICVTRKVLREIEQSLLAECKFVTLPWLCEWE